MRPILARYWPWLLVLASVVAAALALGPGGQDGPPLDPRSTSATGARAVVDVLAELGRPVELGTAAAPGTGTVLVLSDHLSRRHRAALADWARSGGRLVVADPMSPLLGEVELAGRLATDLVGPSTFPPACDDPELADVRAVHSATWWGFRADAGDGACFPTGQGNWLLRRPLGAGELVALGGADAFTNARLDEADNALLLVRLTSGPVMVTTASPPGGGDATLVELVPDRVFVGLALLVLAFVLTAWAHGRRLQRPVEDHLPVRIPASELVLATADLLQRAGLRDSAAAALRSELRREAVVRLGIPEDAPDGVVAERVAVWTGADAAGVERLLAGPPPEDDAALLGLASQTRRLRARLAGGIPPDRGATTTTTDEEGTGT